MWNLPSQANHVEPTYSVSQWDRMTDYVTECATHQESQHPPRAVVSKTRQRSDLEEVVTYKKRRAQIAKSEEATRYKRHLMRRGHDRLAGSKRVVDVGKQEMAMHALILVSMNSDQVF
ncbi:hypothetical protein PsorP6_011003 [Peronosclerospora sorghi]|uniref:Uncharacterized protein n=1 Tax=Peronosclerospora sorghi TaxID=230839 RepID=A0ACC0VVV7_9STRA|nr:hypothetical protein PsorP6_011003 [Peronosclerospora sorghi]